MRATTSTDMFYTRYGNPAHTVAEEAIAELKARTPRCSRIRHERHHHFDAVPAEEWRPRGG